MLVVRGTSRGFFGIVQARDEEAVHEESLWCLLESVSGGQC